MEINKASWTADDYSPLITGKAAEKLADSAIAPLVAWARGYATISSRDETKPVLSTFGMVETGNAKNTLVNQIKYVFNSGRDDEDVLVLPWYSAADVINNETSSSLKPKLVQLRPSFTVAKEGQKAPKYINGAGMTSPMELHPATPVDWPEHNTRVLITEGLPKADSALTAMIIASGVSRAELSDRAVLTLENPVANARKKLAEIMANIPREKRTLITGIVGVANWNEERDWRALHIRDRHVIVAFDADVKENYNVWQQAERIFDRITNKQGVPYILDLNSSLALSLKLKANFPAEEKLGIDDFLSHVGDWGNILDMFGDLPPAPPLPLESRFQDGDWVVVDEPDKKMVVKYSKQTDEMGNSRLVAKPQSPLIGRVVSITSTRAPREEEMTKGKMIYGVKADSSCVVEIMWLDKTGQQRTVEVSGPIEMLSERPDRWRNLKVDVPDMLHRHPKWPPAQNDALSWLGAIKAHREEETVERFAWSAMGWAPTDKGEPVFIVGDQVLGATRTDEETAQVAINDRSMPQSRDYGVIDLYPELVDPENTGEVYEPGLKRYNAQVVNDIEQIVTALCIADVWKDPAYGPLVLAAMFRPTLPVRPTTTMWLYGTPGSGKSWTAGIMMSAWQSSPGVWGAHHLPGSATDTPVAVEQAVSRTPIWVADDLAPSPDSRTAVTQETAISALVRSVHSGSGKLRGTADMTLRERNDPRALLIATGEYDPSVASIRERSILMSFRKGILNDMSVHAMEELCNVKGLPARVTAAMIRFAFIPQTITNAPSDALDGRWVEVVGEPKFNGQTWEGRVLAMMAYRDSLELAAKQFLFDRHGTDKSTSSRQSKLLADLALTLKYLARLYRHCGGSNENILIQLEEIDAKNSVSTTGLARLFDYAAESLAEHKTLTPGKTLIACLRDLLDSKIAHVENATEPGLPPFPGVQYDSLNRSLGWEFDRGRDVWVSRGVSIGKAGLVSSTGELAIWFHKSNSFDEAKRRYPDRILPGQKAKVAWMSAWSDGVCFGKQQGGGDQPEVYAHASSVNEPSLKGAVRGVPVLTSTLLDASFEEEEESEVVADSEEVF